MTTGHSAKSDMRTLFSGRDIGRFALLVVIMLVSSVIECITLATVPLFMALVITPENPNLLARFLQRLAPAMNLSCEGKSLILLGGLCLAAMFVFRTVYLIASYAIQEHVLRNRQIALASTLFGLYLRAPYAFHLKRNSSSIINIITFQVNEFVGCYLAPLLNLIRNLIMIAGIVGFVLWYDATVSIGAFLALGISTWMFHWITRGYLRKVGKAIYESSQKTTCAVTEGIGSIREVTILRQNEFFQTRVHQPIQTHCMNIKRRETLQRSIWPFMELITILVILGIMGAMFAWRGDSKEAIAPTISLLAVALARLKGIVTECLVFATSIKTNATLLGEIAADFRTLEQFTDTSQDGEILPFQHSLKLSKVSFQYPDATEPILRDISLTVPAGKTIAFVGPTGCGKTTLINIILGLLPPQDGTMTVDDTPLDSSAILRHWQNAIGYVPQEPYLLDDSIQTNITLGRTNVSPDTLQRAIRLAQLQEVIDNLPNGLDTIVGERGVHLSGGQRQRLAIARALFGNPAVLVFDEATSALDTITEQAVADAIRALHGKHTILIIAHRLSTIRDCDDIIYLKNGMIAGHGTYTALQSSLEDFRNMTR